MRVTSKVHRALAAQAIQDLLAFHVEFLGRGRNHGRSSVEAWCSICPFLSTI